MALGQLLVSQHNANSIKQEQKKSCLLSVINFIKFSTR